MDTPDFMTFKTDIATEIGLNEAIVAHYLHIMTQEEWEGEGWVYESPEAMRDYLPFLSVATITRCVSKLEKLGVIHRKNVYDYSDNTIMRAHTMNYNHPLCASLKEVSI